MCMCVDSFSTFYCCQRMKEPDRWLLVGKGGNSGNNSAILAVLAVLAAATQPSTIIVGFLWFFALCQSSNQICSFGFIIEMLMLSYFFCMFLSMEFPQKNVNQRQQHKLHTKNEIKKR